MIITEIREAEIDIRRKQESGGATRRQTLVEYPQLNRLQEYRLTDSEENSLAYPLGPDLPAIGI